MPPRPFVCLVNLAELDPPLNGGVARVAWLVSDLLSRSASARLRPVFVVRWGFAAAFNAWVGRDALVVPYFTSRDAGKLLRALRPDRVISPLFGLRPFAGAPAHVAQIPDTLALDHPELFTPRETAGRAAIYAALPSAQRVVTISEFSRRQLLRHTALRDEQIAVVGLGSDLSAARPEDVPGLPDRYVLYPAKWWPHKRHGLLLEMMRRVWERDSSLKLVLPGDLGSAERAALADLPLDAVMTPGRLTDGQLRTAYRRAEALVFTSSYEGFGMPVVEAMGEGCPVLCAPLAALPEVAGDAALYVGSDDPAAWAAALLDELPVRRSELIARGRVQAARFTWSASREGWRTVLADAGVPFDAAPYSPASLGEQTALLAELEQSRQRLGIDWHSDREVLQSLPRLARRPHLAWQVLRLRNCLVRLATPQLTHL